MKIKREISAGGIVYKKSENVLWLVCQHSQHKGWVFPKGLVGDMKKNESKEAAAIRETEEESGVKARIVAPLKKLAEYFYTFEGQTVKKTVYYYLMEYISGDPKKHDWEMSDARFVQEDEVRKLLTYRSDKQAFEQAVALFHASVV